MDLGPGIGDGLELAYEVTDTGIQASNLAFTNVAYSCHSARYCFYCHGGSYLFGCIGLRNKKYCILNKQYTKEEYEEILPKIIQHMNDQPYVDEHGKVYKYGEFFPEAISPFAYNETNAQDYFPLTKEQAIERGYLWRDSEKSAHDVTFKNEDLPDSINEVDEDILKETIECAHKGECNHQCNGVFRIVPQELQFYKNLNLPLPRLCFNCRHNERLGKRTPMHLWERQCMCDYKLYSNSTKHDHHSEGRCSNKFQTSYAPDRPEIVYCEQCYQKEVV